MGLKYSQVYTFLFFLLLLLLHFSDGRKENKPPKKKERTGYCVLFVLAKCRLKLIESAPERGHPGDGRWGTQIRRRRRKTNNKMKIKERNSSLQSVVCTLCPSKKIYIRKKRKMAAAVNKLRRETLTYRTCRRWLWWRLGRPAGGPAVRRDWVRSRLGRCSASGWGSGG